MEDVRSIEAHKNNAQNCRAPAASGRWLNPGNLLIAIALAGSVGALFYGWDWLVAAGAASIIIALAPCLVMCALGLCMSRHNKSDNPASGTAAAGHARDVQRSVQTSDQK